jgi:chorismate synthase
LAVKPTSSIPQTQQTWNKTTETIQPMTVKGRHDLCIALRVPAVVEAVTAMVLADLTTLYLSLKANQLNIISDLVKEF